MLTGHGGDEFMKFQDDEEVGPVHALSPPTVDGLLCLSLLQMGTRRPVPFLACALLFYAPPLLPPPFAFVASLT